MYALPETKIPLGTDDSVLMFLPEFDPLNNIERALYYSLAVPLIKGADVVRHGLATHYAEADKIELM